VSTQPADASPEAQLFAGRLKKTRERQGLNQRELADRSGLTPAAISQLESGQREPTFSTIVRLAAALKTSPNDLMGIGDAEAIDPSLRGLFRDAKKLDAEDVKAVRAFVAYLGQKKIEKKE
jgi:transcriptional regulator with XRE-family HTH domain